MKYIVSVKYHLTTYPAGDRFITEHEGNFGESPRMGDAEFYSTENWALHIADCYARSLRERDNQIKATLKVLKVLTKNTDSVVTLQPQTE